LYKTKEQIKTIKNFLFNKKKAQKESLFPIMALRKQMRTKITISKRSL
jgi:hypothetical protein